MQNPKSVPLSPCLDRQQKLIELNKKRLIPQKELENYLKNIKSSPKVVYQKNIESYLETKNSLLRSAGIITNTH
jgi:hypothetical protein